MSALLNRAQSSTFPVQCCTTPDCFMPVLVAAESIGNQLEVLDLLMIDLEESCERLDLERRKSAEKLKMTMIRRSKE